MSDRAAPAVPRHASPPSRARITAERTLGWAAVAVGLALAVAGLWLAPTDARQGPPQRLMYVHVPAAWVAYATFVMVLVASVAYLLRRDLRWDRRAQAAAELGVGLTALTIVLGSLWGRPVWGVWWTWDPRLITTVVLLLVYVGYLGVRGLAGSADLRARRAAVVGIVGFVNVPVVHFSVVWWRALHQPPTLLQPGGPAPIDGRMLTALLIGLVAFSLGAAWLYLRRLRVLSAADVDPPTPAAGSVPRVVATARRTG